MQGGAWEKRHQKDSNRILERLWEDSGETAARSRGFGSSLEGVSVGSTGLWKASGNVFKGLSKDSGRMGVTSAGWILVIGQLP